MRGRTETLSAEKGSSGTALASRLGDAARPLEDLEWTLIDMLIGVGQGRSPSTQARGLSTAATLLLETWVEVHAAGLFLSPP